MNADAKPILVILQVNGILDGIGNAELVHEVAGDLTLVLAVGPVDVNQLRIGLVDSGGQLQPGSGAANAENLREVEGGRHHQ